METELKEKNGQVPRRMEGGILTIKKFCLKNTVK